MIAIGYWHWINVCESEWRSPAIFDAFQNPKEGEPQWLLIECTPSSKSSTKAFLKDTEGLKRWYQITNIETLAEYASLAHLAHSCKTKD